MVNVKTEPDFVEAVSSWEGLPAGTVFKYADGSITVIPNGFLRDWTGADVQDAELDLEIGRAVHFGPGSSVRYDTAEQKLILASYVSAGAGVRLILNGQHGTQSLAVANYALTPEGVEPPEHLPVSQSADLVIGGDVWIGDQAMLLNGCNVSPGCVIGARTLVTSNFRTDPYGVYAGSPARLLRFRFADSIIEKLLELAWWELPMTWIKANNDAFLVDLAADEGLALETISRLSEERRRWEALDGQADGRRRVRA